MNDYTERQLADGSIARHYDDDTYLVYQKWDTHNIYIKLIHSAKPGHGVARKHLLKFIQHRKNKNFYTYVSDELGADLKLLEPFYRNQGFTPTKHHEMNGERVNYKLEATEN